MQLTSLCSINWTRKPLKCDDDDEEEINSNNDNNNAEPGSTKPPRRKTVQPSKSEIRTLNRVMPQTMKNNKFVRALVGPVLRRMATQSGIESVCLIRRA